MARRDADKESSKPKGWFSRRHQTNEAHLAAKQAWSTRRLRRPRQRWDTITRTWIKEEM